MNCISQKSCNYKDKGKQNIYDYLRMPDADDDIDVATSIVMSAFNKHTKDAKYTRSIWANFSSQNSGYALVSKQIADGENFGKALAEATIVNYGRQTSSNIFVFSLNQDSIVSVNNYENFIKGARANVRKIKFNNDDFTATYMRKSPGPTDHISAEILANVFALNFFETIAQEKLADSNDFDSNNTNNNDDASDFAYRY